jgi:hypothetical protein
MNSRRSSLSIELLLYLLLLGITVWVRLARLDWLALTDQEALPALNAASGANQASPFWEEQDPDNAIYHVLTVALFSLFGSSVSSARMVSAAAGIALVFTPFLLRRQIGATRALVACGLLALSPVAMTISREAGSPAATALGLLLTLFLLRDHLGAGILAGAAFGFSLAAGSAFYTAALGIGLALFFHQIIRRDLRLRLEQRFKARGVDLGQVAQRFFSAGGAAVLILASGIGLIPSGISAVSEGFAAWLGGWTQSGIPALSWIAGLIAYEPFLLVMGLIGAVTVMIRGDTRRLAAVSWLFGSLLVGLIYPARGMSDLIWVVVPLALLSSDLIVEIFERLQSRFTLILGGFSLVFLALCSFSYIQMTIFGAGNDGQLDLGRYLGLSLAGIALVGIGAGVMAAYFSRRLAVSALFISGGLALFAMSISAGFQLNFGASAESARELWRPQVTARGGLAMVQAYQTMSQAATGRVDSLPVSVQGNPNPGLSWIIRDFEPFSQSNPEPAPIILAPELLEGPFLRAEYLGQTLSLSERWGWDGSLPPDLMAWYIFREAPVIEQRWILYARADIAGLGELPVPSDGSGSE